MLRQWPFWRAHSSLLWICKAHPATLYLIMSCILVLQLLHLLCLLLFCTLLQHAVSTVSALGDAASLNEADLLAVKLACAPVRLLQF